MGGILDFWKKFQLQPMKQIFKTTTLGGNPKANLAIAAALIGGGTLLPGLLGGAAASGGAGLLGGASAGGAAAGAGGTLGGTAGMFGAAPGLGASFLTPAAMTPAFTSSLAGMTAPATFGGGTAAMFGPSAAEAASLASLGGPGAGMAGTDWMSLLSKAGNFSDAMGKKEQPPPPPPMPRPTAAPIESIEEILKRRYPSVYNSGGGYSL